MDFQLIKNNFYHYNNNKKQFQFQWDFSLLFKK